MSKNVHKITVHYKKNWKLKKAKSRKPKKISKNVNGFKRKSENFFFVDVGGLSGSSDAVHKRLT